MMNTNKKTPKLRFKGFTDDWEQRKLNDFGIATGGTSIESEFVDGGTYKVINIGSYSEESVYNDQGLRVNKTDKTKSRILNKYDLTMILNDKTASGNIIGRVLLIDQDNTYVYNQRTERIEVDTKNFLPMFLYHMLNAPEQRKYIVKASQGNTQIYVNWSTISNIDYMIPQLLLEQEKIANLFSLINKDITLHQRKLEKLKLNKSALLQKLFPQKGCTIPDVRFKGFTDAWEQCKLSVLATMNARIGWQNLRTSEFLDNGDYLLITGTDFDNGRIKYSTCHYVEKKRFDQDTKIQLSTGSILITKDGTLGKVALVEELPKPATLNAGVFNVRVKDDAFLSYKYLYHYLKAPFLMKYVTANATGGTIKHLNQSILVDFPIPITGKQEQDRIAKLLDSLESIITLHQRKLDCLISIKKGLLQQLFV